MLSHLRDDLFFVTFVTYIFQKLVVYYNYKDNKGGKHNVCTAYYERNL